MGDCKWLMTATTRVTSVRDGRMTTAIPAVAVRGAVMIVATATTAASSSERATRSPPGSGTRMQSGGAAMTKRAKIAMSAGSAIDQIVPAAIMIAAMAVTMIATKAQVAAVIRTGTKIAAPLPAAVRANATMIATIAKNLPDGISTRAAPI